MHWVLQEGAFEESIIAVLERLAIPHSVHKVVPIVGELIPDISPDGRVIVFGSYSIVFGSYSMRHIARRKGWVPGSFNNANFDYRVQLEHWGHHMLNDDAVFSTFADVERPAFEPFFLRPVDDSKYFTGKITDFAAYSDWRHRVVELKEDDGSSLRGHTLVMVAQPKMIYREYRIWIVDGEVVTASLYKLGSRVIYQSDVDPDILIFAQAMAKQWSPDRAYVMDVALVEEGLRIIEVNNINAAGVYAGNIGKIITALDAMNF